MALDSVTPPSESILSGDEQRMAVDLEDGEIEDGEIEDDEIADTISKVSAQEFDTPAKAAPPKLQPPVIDVSMAPRTRGPTLPRRRQPLLPDPPASKRLVRIPMQPVGGRPTEPDEVEDDWADNVEKAIRAAMEKEKTMQRAEPKVEVPEASKHTANVDDMDDKKDKRKKKRKKLKDDEEPFDSKKLRKSHKDIGDEDEAGRSNVNANAADDDEEMMYVRGASPVMKGNGSPAQDYHEYQFHDVGAYEDSYDSYCDDESEGEERREYSPHRRQEGSQPKRGLARGFKRRPMRGRGAIQTRRPIRRDMLKGKRIPTKRPMRGNQEQGRDSVCVFFMQGKCQKGEDCPYSHDVNPPRKLELCKFYLNNCCAKKDKCLYMHNDFPCKFYHMGLKCFAGDRCKFSHGHLSETMRAVLLKHLETAPKEILGDFPRLSREGANAMIFKKTRGKGGAESRKIPSLFEIEVPLPVQLMAEEKARKDSPSLSGTPVPESDDEDGCHTPMPSSPKSDSVLSNVGRSRRWDQDDTSDQSRNLHIDEEDGSQEPELSRTSSLGEKDSEKPRRSSEKKSKKKREKSSQRSGLSRVRSGEESSEDSERRRSHKEERQLKKRLKEESKRNAREEKRLRRSLREERRLRNALEKEQNVASCSVEVKGENVFGPKFLDNRLQDEVQARSNSPWEEPDFSYGKVDAHFEDVVLKQEPNTEKPYTSSKVEQQSLDIKFDMSLRAAKRRSPDERDDKHDQEFKHLQSAIKHEIPVLDTGGSGTDSNDGTNIPTHLPKKQQELFLRIQQQQREAEGSLIKKEKDEDNEEQAEEENWYSSDEEETSLADVLKNLSNQQTSHSSPLQMQASTATPSLAQTLGTLNLGDLSQIDISESVTRLLSSIRHASSSATPSSVTQTAATTTFAGTPSAQSSSSGGGSYGSETPKPSSDSASSCLPEQKQNSPEKVAPPRITVRDPRLLRDPRSRAAANVAAPTNPSGLLSPSSADGRRVDPRSSKPVDDRTKVCSRRSSVVDAPNVYGNAITSPSQTMGISLAGQGDVDLRTMEGVADVDLRSAHMTDVDLRHSSSYNYRDTDLRLSSSVEGNDVDLRKVLGLPFKPVPMHMPATEIDASLTSHPPILYKLVPVTIPRPDYSKLKINPSDPQVFRDPRLRKLFRLPTSPPPVTTAPLTAFATAPAAPVISASRVDPRRARAAAQQAAMQCQEPPQQTQPQLQMIQPQQPPPMQPDMFMPMVPQPPIMMPGMMPPDSMLPRQGPTPGLLGVAPPGFLGIPQMGFCPPPTPRFEDDDDDDDDNNAESDVDLRRMYGWEHQSRGGHMRGGNRRRWRGSANNRRRRADHSAPV